MDREIKRMIEGTYFEENMYRSKRKKLLEAFDKYKTNVEYGIEEEEKNQHDNIIQWYHDILDIKPEAFENVPEKIRYYL